MSEESTSAIAFILNSALFSSFIVPQVQKLKEIKDQLFKFKLTSTRLEFLAGKTEIPKKEIQRLQEVLDSYRVRSEELRSLVRKFYGSVGLAILAIACSVAWPCRKDLFLTLHPILQLLLLIWAIKSYSTDPDKLSSPLYLVKECDVNPHLLIQAIGFGLSYGPETGLTGRLDWDTLFTFTLSMHLRLCDFRFLFIIADDDGKVFYTSFGPITHETKIWRYLSHPAARRSEINLIEIGKFNLNQFQAEKQLRWKLLLFIPIFKQETINPMMMSGNIFIPGKASDTLYSGISGGSAMVESNQTYPGVAYSGEGVDLLDLRTEGRDGVPVVDKVVRRLRNDIMHAKKIESITDLNGLIGAD
jgi:hypothetical protein